MCPLRLPLSRVWVHLAHMAHTTAGSTELSMNVELLDASPAALDQDDQHENKKHAGSDPDKCCLIHRVTPFGVLIQLISLT
jgi:hypothetical protein